MPISYGPVCSSMPVSHTYSFSVVETEKESLRDSWKILQVRQVKLLTSKNRRTSF
jgi:hypothetical protein